MDRKISKEYLKKKRMLSIAKILGGILLMTSLIIFGYRLMRVQIELKSVLHSVADVGSIESSFSTSGIVEPYYQEMITATFATEILKIKYAAGDFVNPSDTLFIPNVESILNDKENIEKEIALKQNQIKKNKLELESKQELLQSKLKKDSILTRHLKSKLEKENYLFSIGGGSQQKVDQADIDFQLACINRDSQLKEFNSFNKQQKLAQEHNLIEFRLKTMEQNKIISQLNKAYVRAKISGIVSSILVETGQHVNAGEALALVSDNSKYKIEGSVSFRYANRIHLAQRVIISIKDSLFYGQLSAISPSVDNGSINFTVHLDNPSLAILRAKLQVELRLIESVKHKVVRIANGDYYFGPGNTDLFVLNGDQLEKRNIMLGGGSFNYVEVISGVSEGETVITSNSFTQKYKRYKTISCKN